MRDVWLRCKCLDSESKVSAEGHDRRKADTLYSLKCLSWHCLGLGGLLKAEASLSRSSPAWGLGRRKVKCLGRRIPRLSLRVLQFQGQCGTNLRVSHILLLPHPNPGPEVPQPSGGTGVAYATEKDIQGYKMCTSRYPQAYQ